jgi:hypothetical protein
MSDAFSDFPRASISFRLMVSFMNRLNLTNVSAEAGHFPVRTSGKLKFTEKYA